MMRTLWTTLFLAIFLGAEAQTNFLPGYIITNKGDTLKGLIDYRSEARHAKRCDFRENEQAPVQEFLPRDIHSYRFNDSKYYVSHSVETDSLQMPVFLEFLVNGISDLYSYYDGKMYHYYIAKKDGQMTELTNNITHYRKDGREYVTRSKKYIGLLKLTFNDCQQLYPMINSAKFNHKSLIAITRKYHDYVCDGEKCILYEKKLPKVKVSMGAFVASNASVFRFSDNSMFSVLDAGLSLYPTAGLQLNTSLPRASEKMSFRLSAEYGKAYFHNSGVKPGLKHFEEIHIHTEILKVKGGFQYTWPKGKIRPTALLGAHYLWMPVTEAARAEDLVYFHTIFSERYQDEPHTERLAGFHVEIGTGYHSKSSVVPFVNLGYEYSRGSSKFNILPNVNININTLQLHAGIYF